ncbi:MAG TPA: TetR/AcrR family transcriptional regulator [Myxococcota bacterium]|nr:TetR/AcrR family transcriptional regulator [Myxococcota bacterium]
MAKNALEMRLRPRKSPRQARSLATQARVLEAARRTFARHGYAGGTTNRIAAQAGISVGSLYQYYPNKDAILAALVRAHIEDGTRALLAALAGAGSELESLVRRAVTALVEVHAADRRLHQVLFEESPRAASLRGELARLEESAVGLAAARLADRYARPADAELAARIVVTTIESLVHRLVAGARPLDSARFIAETTRLVTGYLESSAASGR